MTDPKDAERLADLQTKYSGIPDTTQGVALVGNDLAISAPWLSMPENAASAILGKLRREGLVTRLPDLRAWQITESGRAELDFASLLGAP